MSPLQHDISAQAKKNGKACSISRKKIRNFAGEKKMNHKLSLAAPRLAGCFRSALRPALRTTAWLLRIMLPISFVVTLLQHIGVIAWVAGWMSPAFSCLGLRGASAVAFLTGAMVTTYAGLAVMLTLSLTLREATIIAIMMCLCHALPMECAVMRRIGSSPMKMAALRIAAALVGGLCLNALLPALPQPFMAAHEATSSPVLGEVLWHWITASAKLSAMILALIYGLTAVQRLLYEYGVMRLLVTPLRPLMSLFGLPGNAAYLWLVGNVLGVSYGAAAMIDLEEQGQITREEANVVNYHLTMNHSMLEDTLVFASMGISAAWILGVRVSFAIAVVWGRRVLKNVFRLQTA